MLDLPLSVRGRNLWLDPAGSARQTRVAGASGDGTQKAGLVTRTPSTTWRAFAAVSALLLMLAGCGEAGSSRPGAGGETSPTAQAGAGGHACEPVAGEELVVLEDDKKLQTVDNIIAAVNAEAASEPLMAALNKVSETLTTADLVEMNREVRGCGRAGDVAQRGQGVRRG